MTILKHICFAVSCAASARVMNLFGCQPLSVPTEIFKSIKVFANFSPQWPFKSSNLRCPLLVFYFVVYMHSLA